MLRLMRVLIIGATLCVLASIQAKAAAPTVDEAQAALEKAVRFFREKVAVRGGCLWQYSEDLAVGEGEGPAIRTTVWVQAPGTPFVGQAYLEAYRLTGDASLLEAAVETAEALAAGQLESGGWDYLIEFDPAARSRHAYRTDGNPAGSDTEKRKNVTTLDDDVTQLALRFLMHIDKQLEFQNPRVHNACTFGLESLLKAQYPNGAWPQRYSSYPDPAEHPVIKASYPETWSRTHPQHDYRGYYTFNDNTIADTIDTLFEAGEIYGEPRYRAAAEKAGHFILLAQMPEPQPGWAQQYDAEMHPAWARKFEPPAITGGESQGVMQTLLDIYRRTGHKKYLEPFPRAIEYYKGSRLPDGRLARFYELKTNRPLYFTRKYELTYTSDDLPTHYGFITGSRLDTIEAEYQRLLAEGPEAGKDGSRGKNRDSGDAGNERPRPTPELTSRAQQAIDSLDARGAWVETGRLKSAKAGSNSGRVIAAKTFAKNVGTLSRYIAAAR